MLRANALCERFLGSVRRECLDHLFIFHERHLSRVLKEYVAYVNHDWPHQGIGQAIPATITTKPVTPKRPRREARDRSAPCPSSAACITPIIAPRRLPNRGRMS